MGIKRTQSYFEQIYKEHETSGKSVKEYCKSINLSLSTFYRHRECNKVNSTNDFIDVTNILISSNTDEHILICISGCSITVSQITSFGT